MTEHNYVSGDLVTYCNMPALVTFVNSTGTIADVLLEDNRTVNTATQHLHYLGPGKQYLREALAMAKLYIAIERLNSIKETQDGGQRD